jgi:hypothetical protein
MKILIAAALVLTACGGALPVLDSGQPVMDGGSGTDAGGTDAGATDGGASDGGTAELDLSAAGLVAFVRDGGYRAWRSEAAVHASSGPHGGNVRTWVNDLLYVSLKAGNTTHPPGSVTVKELYSSGTSAITGHAIDVKNAAGTWVFLEGFAPSYANPYYYVGTSNLCGNCHVSGPDYYLSPISNLP